MVKSSPVGVKCFQLVSFLVDGRVAPRFTIDLDCATASLTFPTINFPLLLNRSPLENLQCLHYCPSQSQWV